MAPPWEDSEPGHSSGDRESLKSPDFVRLWDTLRPYDEMLSNYYRDPAAAPQGQAGPQGRLVSFTA